MLNHNQRCEPTAFSFNEPSAIMSGTSAASHGYRPAARA